jgi:nitrogen fixation protein FixH
MTTAKRQIRGAHVLAAMFAFFGAIIAVNVGFTIVALNTFPGEDARRSYLQGLRYNDTLAKRRAETETGWRAFAELAPAPGGAEARVTMRDAVGAPLRGLEMSGELRRPAQSNGDRTLAFSETAPGVYSAPAGALAAGVWIIRGVGRREGAQRSFERRLQWQP